MGRRAQGRMGNAKATRSGPPRGRGSRVDSFTPMLQKALADAQKLEGKDHAAAAASFADIATKAGGSGQHFPAARLQLRAMLSTWADDQDAEKAGAALVAALEHAAAANRPRKAGKVVASALAALGEAGAALTEDAATALGLERLPTPEPVPELNRAQRRTLPKKCACCGTRIKPEGLDWDEQSPSCGYCGNDLV